MNSVMTSELKLTLNTAGVGMWSLDVDTGEVELDETCRELFALSPSDQLSTTGMVQRLHHADIDRYRSAVAECIASGNFACEYRIVLADGTIRHISGRGQRLPRTEGRQLICGVCIDITRSQELEQELQQTRERMQRLADGVPGLFSYLDRDYRLRFLSAQYSELFAGRRDHAIGRHMAEVIGEEAFARRKALYDRAFAGETVCYEETRRDSAGREQFFAFTYQPYEDASGEITGLLALGIDITGRRHAEHALQAQSAELERSNRDLEQFAYVASHDLKAPLRAIDVLVDWLTEDLAGHEAGDVQQNLQLLKQRSVRMHQLLDDLLAYSRAGRQPGSVGSVDSAELVRDIVTLLGPPPTMRFSLGQDMPVLTTCSSALEQVLRNLINNAIKHHPRTDGCITINVQEQRDEWLFAVEDDGNGIPAEYAEKVFQMFQTLRPRDEVEGSGMGLAIVKRIVEGQGGRIWFHPAAGGQGTVFKFTWKKLSEDYHEHSERKDRQHLAG